MPAGFSLVSNLGATSLDPGQSTTFVIRFDATTVGSYAGQFALANNDADESSFVIQVSGQVVVAEPIVKQIDDDGNAGNSLVGNWKSAGKGYANDIHSARAGSGFIYSTWTFADLPDGSYQVWATWTPSGSNASNSPYTISVGGNAVTTVKVNQRVAASGLTADGDTWKSLGTVTVTGGQLSVKLTNAANNTVVADAIRIERL